MRLYRFLQSKRIGNEQLVRQLDRKRHRELFLVALTGLVLTTAVIAYAWPQFAVIQLGYRMEELRIERDRLIEMKRHLELQRAAESSPERIESIAKHELGMIYPSEEQILLVEATTILVSPEILSPPSAPPAEVREPETRDDESQR